MNEYILFVDTETSGLPKDWSKPYSARGNWPHIVQVAWILYTREGQQVKAENYYIKSSDYNISPASRRIHGISEEFLQQNGLDRYTVMQHLHDDLLRYQPLVVGHFMQFDYHMLALGFYRAGLDNPLENLPTFCTMLGTAHFIRLSRHRHMRLSELYLRLFQTPLQNEHDALADASATARCFFELWRKGDIDEVAIRQQASPLEAVARTSNNFKTKKLYLMGSLLGISLIYYLLSLLL